MAESTTVGQRIKAEFEAREKRVKELEAEKSRSAAEQDAKIKKFAETCEQLKQVWRPRLDDFAKQLEGQVKSTPTVNSSQREVRFDFMTDLANVTLTLSASLDSTMTKVVLEYSLGIVPALMEYERHSRLETPLDKPDTAAIGKWIDDRLVDCVRVYLAVQDNQHYQNRAMVEDPITKAKFLKQFAAGSLVHNGLTVYFSNESTLKQFKDKHQLA